MVPRWVPIFLPADRPQRQCRSLGNDDGLDAGGVAVGEGHHSHPLVGDSDACHGDVGLALLHAEQSGVKIHVVDLQLQAQLLGNGLCGVYIDASMVPASVVIS